MRFKMKMAIFFVSVLIALLGFNLIASYVYGDMTMRGCYSGLKDMTSSMAQIEKEPPYNQYFMNSCINLESLRARMWIRKLH